MISPCIACIAYVTLFLFLASTDAVPVDVEYSSNQPNAGIPQDLPLQLTDELDAKGTFTMIKFRPELGYERC